MIEVKPFFDKGTCSLTYVVSDPSSRDAIVIDPVLEYDAGASRANYGSIEPVAKYLRDNSLNAHFILETHAHADHLSAAQVLKSHFPSSQIAMGMRICEVQEVFRKVLDLPSGFPTDGRQFDRLFKDGENVTAGTIPFEVRFTPGHTPACVSYVFAEVVFTGDALFMPDYGTGRCDFPAGSAENLYDSITGKLYTLPDHTRCFTAHDYQPNGRQVKWESTIGEQKLSNTHLRSDTSKASFVEFRTNRDKTLSAPRLLYPSIRINIDAGRMPERHSNGKRYLQIPIEVSGEVSAGFSEREPLKAKR